MENNDEHRVLLERILSYLLENKCNQLELGNLKKIVGDRNKKLAKGVGARYESGILYVKEKDMTDALKKMDTKKLNSYNFNQLEEDRNFHLKLVVDNVMHELFHCDAEIKMSKLHALNYNKDEDIWKRCIAHFWIECTVEYNSRKISFLKNENLLEQISNADWDINCFWDCGNNFGNMYYFIYTASYFVALNLAFDLGDKYIGKVKEDKIKHIYSDLISKSKPMLKRNIYIDDYSEIKRFEMVFKKYFMELGIKKFWV